MTIADKVTEEFLFDDEPTLENILAEIDNCKRICAEIRAEEYKQFSESVAFLAAFSILLDA